MSQDRMNDTDLLHIYHDVVDKFDIEKLLDKFITQILKHSVFSALCCE